MNKCTMCQIEHNRKSSYCSNGCAGVDYRKNNKDRKRKYDMKYNSIYGIEKNEKVKKWQREHPEVMIRINRIRNENNPNIRIESNKKFRIINPKYGKIKSKEYHKNNPEYIKNYTNNRRKTDINFKLKMALSTNLYIAIKNGRKSGRTLELLGCTIPQFKQHIESQWQPGMSWDNYNKTGWHIDHIIPKYTFKNLATNKEEQKICFYYKNQRPLWCTTEVALANGCNEIGNLNRAKA